MNQHKFLSHLSDGSGRPCGDDVEDNCHYFYVCPLFICQRILLFDSISWDFLLSVLKFFNFGESIINWVKVFYNNISSAVIQGGNLSEFFQIGRGCRQGDPLSPYLFILCAEILAIKIRGNTNIGGINVTRIEHKLSQFADDTSLILDGSEKSLNEALLELDWYAKLSGLNINFTKTQVVWIGSKKYSNDTLGQHRNLSWGKTSFNDLVERYFKYHSET